MSSSNRVKKAFFNAGKNIVTSIADGIKNAVGTVTDAIGGVASKIRDFLPFSPAKEGPLEDLDRLDFEGPIGDSIQKGKSALNRKWLKCSVPFIRLQNINVGGYVATQASKQQKVKPRQNNQRTITINNTYTAKEMSPSEIARQEKQMLQRLAMEGVLCKRLRSQMQEG